jgi:hypothetical protein
MSDANYDVEGLYDDDEENDFDEALMEELWWRRTEMTDLFEQIKLLRKERDHARRLFCEWSAGSDRPGEAKEDIARDNGWSNLYKNTNQMESTQENNHDEL